MFSFLRKKRAPLALPFHTDIHCHIIPGVDDGAQDASSAADLIEAMQRWGIKKIIASPHYTQGTFENSPSTIEAAYQELKAELARRGNDIDVSYSGEYRIDDLLERRMAAGELSLLPDNSIIIENSFLQEPWNIDQLVFDLQVRGMRPILAHPERYSYYYNKQRRYKQLHDAGLAFQLNVLSLAGAYGKAEQKVAESLISEGFVDYLGTDLHRRRHVEAIDEYLTTKTAEKHFHDLAGMIRNDTDFGQS
ncbi:MAG: hypothetical protein K2M06_00410 [Muribaculaceae bacterium]|nr:hypothetical protein [Muribaculaceae bacterium]